jgi:hypothetical protein
MRKREKEDGVLKKSCIFRAAASSAARERDVAKQGERLKISRVTAEVHA